MKKLHSAHFVLLGLAILWGGSWLYGTPEHRLWWHIPLVITMLLSIAMCVASELEP